jgi:2-hydroxycyclohexanecarboxyl-CoA dehydrogenase
MSDFNDQFWFAGKTVIVTGGNGGIGQGLVDAFSERDANVAILDFAPPVAPLRPRGTGKVIDIRADITDRASVDLAVAEVIAAFGPVDVLIHNAGGGKGMARLPELTDEIVDWTVRLNVNGTVNMMQSVGTGMIARRSGAIVNIASNAALSGMAGRFDPIYAGCKGFVLSFTKALAADLGEHNVRLNTIAPGWTVPESSDRTSTGSFWARLGDMFGTPESFNAEYERTGTLHASVIQPLRRLGRPSDIANAALYFASDAARHITGQLLSIGGGDYMPS